MVAVLMGGGLVLFDINFFLLEAFNILVTVSPSSSIGIIAVLFSPASSLSIVFVAVDIDFFLLEAFDVFMAIGPTTSMSIVIMPFSPIISVRRLLIINIDLFLLETFDVFVTVSPTNRILVNWFIVGIVDFFRLPLVCVGVFFLEITVVVVFRCRLNFFFSLDRVDFLGRPTSGVVMLLLQLV